MSKLQPLAPVAVLALILSCGGVGGGTRAVPMGSLALRLGSDSFPGYSSVVVSVEKVEGSVDGTTWTTLGEVKSTFDLMALQNGNSAVLLPATSVPQQAYSQFRLTWAQKNYQSAINLPAYITAGAGVGQPLVMPATTVIPGSVRVTASGTVVGLLLFSGQQAVVPRGTPSTTYTFQATGNGLDQAGMATITGHLGDVKQQFDVVGHESCARQQGG